MITTSENTTPPGQWRYLVPETGTWLRGYWALTDLMSDLTKHYVVNKLQWPGDGPMKQRVLSQLCPQLPKGYCKDSEAPIGFWKRVRTTFSELVQGTSTLGEWLRSGRKVDPAEANERASICIKCPQNQEPEGCVGCNMPSVQNLVNSLRGGSRTPYDSQLRACNVCGCSLQVKVWVPSDIILKHTPASQLKEFPDGCWLKSASLNAELK